MSRENVKNFYEMLKVDANLAQELMKLKEELEKGDKKFLNDEYVINEKIIPLAKKHGLSITADEFTSVSTKLLNKLDEEDLLKVSGGGCFGSIVATLMSCLQCFICMPVDHNATNVNDTAQIIQAEGQQHHNIPAPETEESEMDIEEFMESKPETEESEMDIEEFMETKLETEESELETEETEETKLETEESELETEETDESAPEIQANKPRPLADTLFELAQLATRYYDEGLRRVLFFGSYDVVTPFFKAYFLMERFPLGKKFINRSDISEKPVASSIRVFLSAENSSELSSLNEKVKQLDDVPYAKDMFVALVYHLIAYRVGGIRKVYDFNYDEALNECPKLKAIFDSADVEGLKAILER